MTMAYLQYTAYSGIMDRRNNIEKVRTELNRVVASQPTQIQPDDREGYLNALLADLQDKDSAPWTTWPEDVYLLALTAVKTLGRNPIGSQTLLTECHLSTIIYHTFLPRLASLSSSTHPPASPISPQALEAMKILANILVLHPAGRKGFADLNGGKMIARELSGKDANGSVVDEGDWEEARVERLFLLGRIGFLVTMDRAETVGQMVHEEGLVEHLGYFLSTLPLIPSNYAALAELLKLVNNVLRYYPYDPTSSSISTSKELWDDKFAPLLYPLLVLLHTIPTSTLSPPLTQILHILLSIPFIPSLLPIWQSRPLSATSSPSPPSPPRSVKSLFSRISGKTSPTKLPTALPIPTPTPIPPPRSKSPLSFPKRGKSPIPRPITPTRRIVSLPERVDDAQAFPKRVLEVLEGYFEKTLRPALRVDGELPREWILDEVLPPVLLLLARAASGSLEMREYLKERLLPSDLDRSPEAGPLERRKSTLGTILLLMGSGEYHQCRDTAGELLWEVCGGDASVLSHEIGYGNAAGLLCLKGITSPPPARIDEITTLAPDTTSTSTTSSTSKSTSKSKSESNSAPNGETRHPITSLQSDVTSLSSPFDTLSEEEKEREAEKLFVLFERMEKNQMIKAKGDDGVERGIGEVVRGKIEEVEGRSGGEFERGEERRRVEEEERDEREAMRDLESYRRRKGGR